MNIKVTNIIKSTPFLNFNETVFVDQNGNDKKWNWVGRVGDRKAVLIVATVGDKLVVTKEYRVPLGGYEYSFPAGLIDGDESPSVAAIRELKEETGLDTTCVISESPAVYNSAGLTNESIYIVKCKAEGMLSKSGLESSEDIETLLLDQKEVEALMKTEGCMLGAKSYIYMERFVETGVV